MSTNVSIHAVVFDMDGVLVDSEPIQYRACQMMLSQVGLPLSEVDFKNRWVGHKTIDSLRETLEEHAINADAKALMRLKDEAYHHLISTEPLQPRPGVRWLLAWLRDRGIPCAVASSSSHADIRFVLRRLGIINHFEHLISSEDCEHPKPAPDIYLLSAVRLGLPAQRCLAIEDSSVGAQAAKAAGMFCVAFPHRYTYDQDFSMVDALVEDLRELPKRFRLSPPQTSI